MELEAKVLPPNRTDRYNDTELKEMKAIYKLYKEQCYGLERNDSLITCNLQYQKTVKNELCSDLPIFFQTPASYKANFESSEYEEQEKRKHHGEEKKPHFEQKLGQLKRAILKADPDESTLINNQFQALESEANELKSVEFFVARARFYENCSKQQINKMLIETFLIKARGNYEHAVIIDQFSGEMIIPLIKKLIEDITKLRQPLTSAFLPKPLTVHEPDLSNPSPSTMQLVNMLEVAELEKTENKMRLK